MIPPPMPDLPQPGAPAPAFDLEAADGARIGTETLRGNPFVLFFFPKAATPG